MRASLRTGLRREEAYLGSLMGSFMMGSLGAIRYMAGVSLLGTVRWLRSSFGVRLHLGHFLMIISFDYFYTNFLAFSSL